LQNEVVSRIIYHLSHALEKTTHCRLAQTDGNGILRYMNKADKRHPTHLNQCKTRNYIFLNKAFLLRDAVEWYYQLSLQE